MALVEQKVPNGGFEALKRDMTGQLGVEPSSLEGVEDWEEVLAEPTSLDGRREAK